MQPVTYWVSHDDYNATTFLRSSSVVNKTGCFKQIFIHKSVRLAPTMYFSFIFHVLHPESRASGAGAGGGGRKSTSVINPWWTLGQLDMLTTGKQHSRRPSLLFCRKPTRLKRGLMKRLIHPQKRRKGELRLTRPWWPTRRRPENMVILTVPDTKITLRIWLQVNIERICLVVEAK